MNGFFSKSKITSGRKPLPLLAHCGDCGFYKTCRSPYMPVYGQGQKGIMFVGEFPSKDDDRQGKPFTDGEGDYLKQRIKWAGLDPEKDCWFTNALICHPPSKKDSKASVDHCRPNLLKAIKDKQPKVIVLLGQYAIKSLIGYLWKEDVGEAERWYGWDIPCQRFNAWVCPTWHPSFLQSEKGKHKVRDDFFYQHIKTALRKKGRPWKEVPDYRKQVQILTADEAAPVILRLSQGDRPVAFDYESNMLKPDTDEYQIICCSLSDGQTTIAFPWMGVAVEAMKKFLVSDVPKEASNMKYEHRATRSKLGLEVKNWKTCTMLCSHVLDNRPDICGLKFQSFVNLGQEDYSDHISSFLSSKEKGGYSKNTIKNCDLNDLMLYCGLDSLLENKVARIQQRKLDVSLLRSTS